MSKVKSKVPVKKLLLAIMLGIVSNACFGDSISVFYSFSAPQQEFAANDIKTALEARSFTVEFKDLSTLTNSYEGKKVVIAIATNTEVVSLLLAQGGTAVNNLEAQAYALRTTSSPEMSYWVLGGDDNGAMYGGLQLAENISFNGYTGSYNEEESPYLKNRGIKFNIPLDKESPTYYYDNDGTSHKLAIRHVWDIDFWTTWFDEMARHRYNVLSLWSPHPFTAMLNMEDEYPGIAIQGVTGYDENGNDMVVNNMTIDEKIDFWKQVMEYGKNRGFSTYFCTWNIFLSTAEGKHGLTDGPNDQETRTYLRKCMKKFLETYPDLSGFGITVGENMGGLNDRDKEEWAWDTYGKGMMEYAQENPERDLVFIHRQHQGNVTDMLDYFKALNDLPNVRFDLSFKYSQAHAHAAVKPDYWDRRNMEDGLGPNNLMSWLTIRNDDFYFLHWANPQFVRDYVNNFPEVDKYVNAFYIGSDGWVFTKVFTSKHSYYEDKDALSIQKTWYMQKLWGRISYNPSVSDDFFKSHLALKYPGVSSDQLFDAWSKASRAILLANEQVTGTWDLDFKWWPEGWTSNGGFLGLGQAASVDPMNGSNLCDFQNTANNNCNGKISALTNADEIEQLALDALSIINGLSPGADTELELNLKDLEAMSYLSIYNAYKFRAAVSLNQGNTDEARNTIRNAICYWQKYTSMMAELYKPVDLQRNSDFGSWNENDAKALQDFTGIGGTGEPKCSDDYPWVYINSPGNSALFAEPADVSLNITADAGTNSIDRIELICKDTLVDTDYTTPYSFDIAALAAGFYSFTAVVYDDQGRTDNYSINIIVYDASSYNTVPWIEDFTLTNGSTIDNGQTSWTSSRPEGNFFVQNNTFIVNGDGAAGVLTSGEIDISGGPVDISLDLWSEENLESDDFVKLYKIVDNGQKTLIGSKVDNQDTPTSIIGSASGNTLVLIIEAKVSYSGEYYYMDNLRVTYNPELSGVKGRGSEDIKLYPNPANDEVYIYAPDEYSFSLFNMNGIVMKKMSNMLGTQILDLKGIQEGVYFLKIVGKSYQSTQKLVRN